jgi:hypothetical protein
MRNAVVDWNQLSDRVSNTQEEKRLFSEYHDKITKVAFDVWKTNEDNAFWKVEKGEDGEEYLVRIKGLEDQDTDDTQPITTPTGWTAEADGAGKNITLSYLGIPLCKFASERFGFDSTNAEDFKNFVVTKTTDSDFVDRLLTIIPEETKAILLEKMTSA